ncbi:MAG: hypothetical protein ACM3VS_16735 [Candidatus Dadabacteria bacterium]
MKSERDQENDKMPAGAAGRNIGRQGNDKAPGEETSSGNQPVTPISQKGKNKVDGDPSKESDKPIDFQNI